MNYLFDRPSDLSALFRQFERIMEQAMPTSIGQLVRSARSFPLVNVAEDANSITVEALAPGINPETLQINVLRNQLTIAGERPVAVDENGSANVHRLERPTGRFTRTMTLPGDVDDSNVTAEYRAGVLTINLPKAEAAKSRRIAVHVA
jgi:HSP20 family protein